MFRSGYIPAVFIITVLLGFTLLSSCKKEQFLTTGGDLGFSADTLTFDTVFTNQGSFTLAVKIYNNQNNKIKINSVRLQKGDNSFFTLNVNGIPGKNVTDIEVAANDSIYVFATVNIDPNNDTLPFVVEDQLIASLNGREFSIPFLAYGQNAYYILGEELTTQTWKTDKPYVIIHSALVKENEVLTIPKGCRIFMHADSRLYVLGKLLAEGTKQDSIIFQGDRLDRKYFGNVGYPGEWGGLYFAGTSRGSRLNWVVLKNCGNSPGTGLPAAVFAESVDNPLTDTQLSMRHTIIDNSLGYGVACFNAYVYMENCLVHSTGAQALGIFQGGKYTMVNCDFINYNPPRVSHTENTTGAILNYLDTGNGVNEYKSADLMAVLTNCMIYGTLDEELVTGKKGNNAFSVILNNCLIKSSNTDKVIESATQRNNCKFNQDPLFEDYTKMNYRAKNNTSPLFDAGIPVPGLSNDLDDKPRTIPIDIGCYEL